MKPRKLLSAALVVLAVLAAGPAGAQEQRKTAQNTKEAAQDHALAAYLIGPEDLLAITVWKNAAMSRIVSVRPDGMISLPLLNDVRAAGLTPMALRDVLAEKLVQYIPNPEVSVIVDQIRSFKVSVVGEVSEPGRYRLGSWTTVLDVLAQAGGLTEFASRSRIFVLRPDGQKMTRIRFNYNKFISARGEEQNFYLRPGDIVVVP